MRCGGAAGQVALLLSRPGLNPLVLQLGTEIGELLLPVASMLFQLGDAGGGGSGPCAELSVRWRATSRSCSPWRCWRRRAVQGATYRSHPPSIAHSHTRQRPGATRPDGGDTVRRRRPRSSPSSTASGRASPLSRAQAVDPRDRPWRHPHPARARTRTPAAAFVRSRLRPQPPGKRRAAGAPAMDSSGWGPVRRRAERRRLIRGTGQESQPWVRAFWTMRASAEAAATTSTAVRARPPSR